MPAARCADFVFTTDIDCIKKYKNALGHDNVFFLHFAAQPKVHNPIEKYERKDKFCFAGAYYHKYPNRTKTFDNFSEVFLEKKVLIFMIEIMITQDLNLYFQRSISLIF